MQYKKVAIVLAVIFSILAAFAGYVFLIRPEQKIQEVIKRLANDPDSVQLRDLQQSAADPEVWCGSLNARNKMGGMVGFKKFVISAPGFNDFDSDKEVVELLARITLEDNVGFEQRRRLYCK